MMKLGRLNHDGAVTIETMDFGAHQDGDGGLCG
jgi:hypothetical protein